MTKLHFNYKDIFSALRLGFSAKKVWIAWVGLVIGLAGYSGLGYLAHLIAGSDLLAIWGEYRLLPFPDPLLYPFPWYAWLVYAVGVLFFISSVLIAGTAVSKVAYEQLRGDEFYESREAFRFALRHWCSVLASPLLLIGFAAVVGLLGLATSAIGGLPFFGDLWLGLFALPAFFASLFLVYLFIVLLVSLLIGPSVVGATKNDTFDTVFEAFSCVNEQPARLALYVGTVAVLSRLGCGLLAIASTLAAKVGYAILRIVPGAKLDDITANAGYYFNVTLPDWWPEPLQALHYWFLDLLDLPWLYELGDYVSINWASDISSVLIGAVLYIVVLIVIAFGCSVWFSGNTLAVAVLIQKKDDKNLLEVPEDEDLFEPVVDVPGKPEPADTGEKQPKA